jgi:hypothetical protein
MPALALYLSFLLQPILLVLSYSFACVVNKSSRTLLHGLSASAFQRNHFIMAFQVTSISKWAHKSFRNEIEDWDVLWVRVRPFIIIPFFVTGGLGIVGLGIVIGFAVDLFITGFLGFGFVLTVLTLGKILFYGI